MVKIYESLKGVVKGTLDFVKTDSIASARVNGSDAGSLNAMEELEILADRIGRLKVTIRDSQAAVAEEAQQAAQVVESLRANITLLEANVSETEEAVRRKDVENHRMNESLNSKICDLESVVNKKDEALESLRSEVNDLNSKMSALIEQGTHLELRIQQATDQAAREALRAHSISETSQVRIATLEAQLRNTEEIVARRNAAIQELKENLTEKIQELESDVRNKETLLSEQIRHVTDLKAELQRQTGIKERSFFGETGASGGIETGRAAVNEQLKTGEEKPAASDFGNAGIACNVTDAYRQTVSLEVFDRMINGLFEVTDVMRPLAALIVRNHVDSLGESMEDFPQARLTELLEAVSKEISDDKLRTVFRQHLGKL